MKTLHLSTIAGICIAMVLGNYIIRFFVNSGDFGPTAKENPLDVNLENCLSKNTTY